MLSILVGLLSIVAGVIVGATPFLRDFVHLYAWATIPVSGLIFGGFTGLLQFLGCYQLGITGSKLKAVFFGVCAVLAFVGADVGEYASIKVPVHGNARIPDGEYKLSSLISLREFVEYRFAANKRHTDKFGSVTFSVSAAENRIGYAVEVLEVAAVSTLVLFGSWATFRVCVPCGVYLRRRRSWKIHHNEGAQAEGALGRIHEAMSQRNRQAVVDVLERERTRLSLKARRYQIDVEERCCTRCNASLIRGKVTRLEGNKWVELPQCGFEASEGQLRAAAS